MSTQQIRLTGAGGQGLVLAGIILAEAAMQAGYNVAVAQSYGPEARLGASRAEVIISTEKIAYPQIDRPDLLLCLSQEAFDKYATGANSCVLVLADSTHVTVSEAHNEKIVTIPLERSAVEQIGTKIVTNVVSLGALNALTHFVSWGHLEEAIARRTPERYRAQNIKALEIGRQLVIKAKSTT